MKNSDIARRWGSVSSSLDWTRMLLANLVVLNHLRIVTLPSYGELKDPGEVDFLIYATMSIGKEAVIAFFVISGYFVGGKVIKLYRANLFSLKLFIIERLSRLWLVLIPALFLTALINIFVCKQDASSSYCSDRDDFVSGIGLPIETTSLKHFLGTTLFLPNFTDKPFGANSPLWSIFFEVWSYIFWVSILGFFFYLQRRNLIFIAYSVPLLISVMVMIESTWVLYLFFWTFGSCLSILNSKFSVKVSSNWLSASSILLLFLTLLLDRYWGSRGLIVCLGLIFVIYASSKSDQAERIRMKERRLSLEYSFSLYCIHFPLIGLIETLNLGSILKESTSLTWLALLVTSTFLILINITALIFASIFETKTYKIRRYFTRAIG